MRHGICSMAERLVLLLHADAAEKIEVELHPNPTAYNQWELALAARRISLTPEAFLSFSPTTNSSKASNYNIRKNRR